MRNARDSVVIEKAIDRDQRSIAGGHEISSNAAPRYTIAKREQTNEHSTNHHLQFDPISTRQPVNPLEAGGMCRFPPTWGFPLPFVSAVAWPRCMRSAAAAKPIRGISRREQDDFLPVV